MPDFVCPRLDLSLGLQSPPPVPRPIVGGYFIERNLNIVVGQPGSYKTIFMLEVCSAIALGRPAFGLYPVEEGRVAFITADDPPEVVIDRMLMLNAEVINGKRIINPAVRKKLAENVDVRAIDQVVTMLNRDVARFVAGVLHRVSFAVFDPLRFFIGQADENKASEIHPQLAPLRQMAVDLPCAITLIHHAKKDNGKSDGAVRNEMNAYSGSGAIRGLSRAQLNIRRINPGVLPAQITVVGENRYGAEPAELTLEIAHTDGVIEFVRPSLSNIIYRMLLESNSAMSTNDILVTFQEPASAVRAALYRLRDKGLVESHKEGKRSVWRRTTKIDTSVAPSDGPLTDDQRAHTADL